MIIALAFIGAIALLCVYSVVVALICQAMDEVYGEWVAWIAWAIFVTLPFICGLIYILVTK